MKKYEVSLQFTYDKVTPESAEHGDFAEHGFYAPGGWEYPIGGCEVDPEDCYDLADCPEPEIVSAREALREIRDTINYYRPELRNALTGVPVSQLSELSVCDCDGREDYSDGSNTRISAHVKGHPRLIAALARELLK